MRQPREIGASRKLYLLDGPMLLAPERKAERVAEMAEHLLAANVYLDRGDAIRLLCNLNYPALDVMLCVDDARHLALEMVIAAEMADQ